jgi:PAS domain S-box-containing protein
MNDDTAALRDAREAGLVRADSASRRSELVQRGEQDTEARLQAILNSVADGIITIDGAGSIISFNPAATKMFEYEEAEAAGKNLEMLMPDLNRGHHGGYLARHRSTGKSTAIGVVRELEGLSKTGRTFPMELTVTEMPLEGQKFFVGVVRDISERIRHEEALRLGNENEQKLIMGVKDYAILMLSPEGIVTTWNEGAERIKGYRAEEIVGYHYSKFYPPEAIAAGKPARELQIATEQGRFEEEAWRVRKDGSRFWANVVITALFDANGKLRGFGKVTRDISERKAVEAERVKIAAELARYTRALERSNLELDAFAYAASHDLKAPLRVIHNASTWIEEDLAGKLTAEMSENMNLLRSRVRRMDKLLDDLLEYSRIGRETDDRHTEAISGSVLMENIQGLISPPAGFIVDATPSLAGIEVFRMPLQQILINLISNAIKHHDKKTGRIEVSVEDLGANWGFSVKDDGPGIPAEYHEKIFKMFQTLKPRDQVEGSGMGLAMVRKHIDVAGGELKLESTLGRGSTFSFTWPKDNGSTNKTKHKFTPIGEAS